MQTSKPPIQSGPSPYPYPLPYPSPYPPPMYGSGYQVELFTQKGLKYFTIALLLFVILFFTGTLIFSLAIFGIDIGFVIVILAIFFPLAIIILFILGISFLNSGKFEFGPVHVNNVKKANIFTILVVVFMVFSMLLPVVIFISTNRSNLILVPIIILVCYSVLHISVALALIYYVKAIISDKYRKMLFLPLIIIIIVPIMYFLSMYDSAFSDIISPVIMMVYLVVLTLFFIFYRNTFLRVRAGLIKPLMLPLPPVYPMYPYPYPGHPSLAPPPQPYQNQRSPDKTRDI
jgi:hypothetical protein